MDVIGPDLLIPGAAALAGLLLGVLLARFGRRERRRVAELEVRVSEREARILQLEGARAELAARLATAEQEREEAGERLASYQQEVVGHFSQTSDLLKEMTLQYRNIYQHLAQGAEALLPDGALGIATHAPIESLVPSPEKGLEPLELDDDDGASVDAAHCESPVQVDPRPEL